MSATHGKTDHDVKMPTRFANSGSQSHYLFEGDPLEFALVDFAFWRPRPPGLGTDGRVALGTARGGPITGEDVRWLVTSGNLDATICAVGCSSWLPRHEPTR
jgi:hypothetical protein